MYYEPVRTERFVEKKKLYSDVDWKNLGEVVGTVERKFRGWYIEPVEILLKKHKDAADAKFDPGHNAFAVMAITCMLIDALSQYRYGALISSGDDFKRFINDFLPDYKLPMPGGAVIVHFDDDRKTGRALRTLADVLWNGFRCGILHQAHASLYCGINPGVQPPQVEPRNLVKYGPQATVNHSSYGTGPANLAGLDCPAVIVYPEHLFQKVEEFFTQYIRDLLDAGNPDYDKPDGVRTLFKIKVKDAFGVPEVAQAVL